MTLPLRAGPENPGCHEAWLTPNDLQLWRLLGCQVEAGLGEEAVEQAGPVLHPPSRVLTSAVS